MPSRTQSLLEFPVRKNRSFGKSKNADNNVPSPIKKNLQTGKAFQRLKHSFASSNCSHLVGRASEMEILEDFMKTHLCEKKPGSMYVSGAPGTGKTASVCHIIDKLKVPRLKKIFLNCMAQKSSKEIFSQIASHFKVSCTTEKEIKSSIERSLTIARSPILIILDEVDQLESKHQEVLYTIFEWPALANSKLVLIGIANMLDLTDRVLPRLQSSTCRPTLLHFPPYSKDEIIAIINERVQEADLDDFEVFKPSAIQFLAGKISSVTGDVRKALDVCRRAVELCEMKERSKKRERDSENSPPEESEHEDFKQIDIPQILNIFNEVFGSRVTASVTNDESSFPMQQKVLLCTLLLFLKNGKSQTITVGQLHDVYSRICRNQMLPVVDQSEFFSLCTLLETRGILQVKIGKEPRNSKVFARLNQEEAERALGDKNLLCNILNDVSSLGKLARNSKK